MTKQTDAHTCLKHNSDQAQPVQYPPQTGHAINRIRTYAHRGLNELTGSFDRRWDAGGAKRLLKTGRTMVFRAHPLETSQLPTKKNFHAYWCLKLVEEVLNVLPPKTPYSVTEWRSSKTLTTDPPCWAPTGEEEKPESRRQRRYSSPANSWNLIWPKSSLCRPQGKAAKDPKTKTVTNLFAWAPETP